MLGRFYLVSLVHDSGFLGKKKKDDNNKVSVVNAMYAIKPVWQTEQVYQSGSTEKKI